MTKSGRELGPVPRLRICLVSAAYHPYPSGVSEHVSHLASALSARGHDVQVLTTSYASAHDDAGEPVPITRLGRAVRLPLNGSYATLPVGARLPRQVRGFLAGQAFDVIHCHGVFWPEISYWAIRNSRAVNVVSFLSAGDRVTDRGSTVFRTVFARELSRIHGRVAISDRALRTYAPYVPGPTRIIPSGVDTERFRPDVEPLPSRRGRDPRILFVGRLDRRKGLDVLVRAMPLVRRQVPGAALTVVGDGPGMAASRSLAATLGVADAVTFVGRAPRSDLPGYYTGCDVYCSPALGGESFGIVLLEAMASGTPVVASDIPGYDETVNRDRTGLLVPPGDPEALAAALRRALTDDGLRATFVAAGLARARQHAWPRIAESTEDYYRSLLVTSDDGRVGESE